MNDYQARGYIKKHGLPKRLCTDCYPGREIHICEEIPGNPVGEGRILLTLTITDSHDGYKRAIISELVKAYNEKQETQ